MGERKPVVSVVVPTRDRAAMLRAALASVRAAEGDGFAVELIVADNGSTDDTRDVAREFGARVIEAPRPGASAARNDGLRAATGDYVTFLDDDDVWLPGHPRAHVELLERRPDLGAAVGRVQLADPEMRPFGEPYPERWPADGDMVAAFFRDGPQVASVVSRIEVRDTVGFFDEGLPSSEDWQWHLRLAMQHRIGFVTCTCILFRQRPVATHDDLEWLRLRTDGPAFWRALRITGKRRPPLRDVVHAYLTYHGRYYAYFSRSAVVHGERGERAAARRCVWRAVRASPLHAAYHLARGGEMRRAVRALMNR